MRLRTKLMSIILVLLTAITILASAQTDAAKVLLEAAKKKEVVDGDLNAAIQQYKAIVAKFPKERSIVADALIHMAKCYQKLGDSESRKIYERLATEFADQKEAVSVAKAALGVRGTGMVSRQVWSGRGVETNGTVSPDGRYISHVDWSTGSLALHDLRTGTDRHLASDGLGEKYADYAEWSAISRDGKLVAYSWFSRKNQNYELRVANIEGDPNPRPLYSNSEIDEITPYDWTPDGKLVVVGLKRKEKTAQIGFVSVSDGSLRVLKSVDWRRDGRIFLSPDGKYLGYDLPMSDISREHDIFVLPADGTHEVVAVADPSVNLMIGWSPDGKHLLFASDRTGLMSLWAVSVADGKVQGTPELIRPDFGLPQSMGMTRSGGLYYSTGQAPMPSNIQVASFDPETGQISSAKNVGQQQPEGNSLPCWSPDGGYLAYLSRRGLSNSDFSLVIRSAETYQAVRELPLALNRSTGDVRLLRWSPDGRFLWVTGTDVKGRWGLHRIDAQSGDVSPISLDLPRELQWPYGGILSGVSPDAKMIYFRRSLHDPNGFAHIQRDLASGTEKELIRRPIPGNGGGLNLSPDGRYIATAFPSTSDATSVTVLLIPTAGGEPREMMQVHNEPSCGDGQTRGIRVWEPDSSAFLVQTCMEVRGRQTEMWRVPVNGDPPRKLAASSVPGPYPAIHPDGRHIAYVVTPQATNGPRAEVWVLENFLPTLKVNR